MGVGVGTVGSRRGAKVTTTFVASQTWDLYTSFPHQIHTAAFDTTQNVGFRSGNVQRMVSGSGGR